MSEIETTEATLSLGGIQRAIAGDTAAIRVVTRLEPGGGPGDKVFPPTYAGGRYAMERRRLDGEEVDTVLLDSVQSQANRMELALRAAHDRGDVRFPLIVADFSNGFPHIGRITALDAPHRIADAIFRESRLIVLCYSLLGKRTSWSRSTIWSQVRQRPCQQRRTGWRSSTACGSVRPAAGLAGAGVPR